MHAGKNVSFVFTDVTNKRFERRVRAEQLIERGVNPDVKRYLLLLYASAANLLAFAGYTQQSVYDAVRGYNSKSITEY